MHNIISSLLCRSDQLMAYYKMDRRTVRWYRKLFFHLLHLVVVNAHILFNHLKKESGQKSISLLKFVDQVTLGWQLICCIEFLIHHKLCLHFLYIFKQKDDYVVKLLLWCCPTIRNYIRKLFGSLLLIYSMIILLVSFFLHQNYLVCHEQKRSESETAMLVQVFISLCKFFIF